MEIDELPYRVEYAKSGRSKCKGCKEGIEKEHLRLAVMIQSPVFDGKVPNWYHINCFFVKQRPKGVSDIAHFESIKWDDQQKIKTKLESLVGTPAQEIKKRKSANNRKTNQDFNVEYAKSGRAVCCGCQDKIVKDDLRVGKMDYESEEARRFGGINRWHHLECFIKLRTELGFLGFGCTLNGYSNLKVEDKKQIQNLLPGITKLLTSTDYTDSPGPSKKPKIDNKNLESSIKKQNILVFKYRDYLKTLNSKIWKHLLEYNKQEIPSSNHDATLDRLSDAMAFGTLLPCDECKGQLVFRSGVGYQCSGYKNEWLKCEKVFSDPSRVKFEIPSHILESDKFLSSYECKVQKRVFLENKKSLTSTYSTTSDKGLARVTRILPLRNMEFTTNYKGLELKNLKLKLPKYGGTLITQCTDSTAAVFSTAESIGKKSVKMKDAQENNVEIVEPTEFFDAIDKGGNATDIIAEKNVAPWGGDVCKVKTRIEKRQKELEAVKSLKSKSFGKSMYEKSVPTSIKLTLKGGVAVEPQSELQHKAHVYKHNNVVWNANLCLSDVQSGKNSYYKIQLLESDNMNSSRYWVFRSWGRIGTTIGGFKTVEHDTLEDAKTEFECYYEDQTGNLWKSKNNFVKMPGKKVPVDTDYDQDETKSLDTVSNLKCKLPDPVQKLIRLLFDVEAMKRVMYEFELDLQKMPLGKLSRKQMQLAYTTLTDLNNIMDSDEECNKQGNIIETTNRFYTLIPHDFGIKNPPLINSKEILNEKLEMISNLMDIEIAYNMMDAKCSEDSTLHPLDTQYLKLNCTIEVLDSKMNEFSIIEQYIRNTHAETHQSYSLDIKDVFKVVRSGEEKRFKPFKKLHNRKMLWHGSRVTNFAAILSQGLRIAPKEAPVTGYMFGKGIYFADMVSKSANYCMASHTNNSGLLLLCEVALGNMDEHKRSYYVEKLPAGKHSCKGIGRTMPNPAESIFIDDKVEIPLGKPVPSNVNDTVLLYNEFIVYDISQVKIRYMVKVDFKFEY